jgi:hypothetical protein
MGKLDERTRANMDVALENICRTLPNSGGDHETRKYIARKLTSAAKKGQITLTGLEAVARLALAELSRTKSA